MKNTKLLTRVLNFLGKVISDCQDADMAIEARYLADEVFDKLHDTDK